MKLFLSLALTAFTLSAQAYPDLMMKNSRKMLDLKVRTFFLDQITNLLKDGQNDLTHANGKDFEAVKFLFQHDHKMSDYVREGNRLKKKFGKLNRTRIELRPTDMSMIFDGDKGSVEITQDGSVLAWKIKSEKQIIKGNTELNYLADDYISTTRQHIFYLVSKRDGLSYKDWSDEEVRKQSSAEDKYFYEEVLPDSWKDDSQDIEIPLRIASEQKKNIIVRFYEKVYDESTSDFDSWKFAPVKLIAYPATKLFYDIPGLITSIPVEGISRSPVHNAKAVGDEIKQAGNKATNGLIDVGMGLLNPTNARALDGALTVVDASVSVVKAGTNVIKTAISVVGYPLYRLRGGKPSQRVPLKGRRATIVIIDSAVLGVIDAYGDMIAKFHARGISAYYCSTNDLNYSNFKNHECVKNMPNDIEYLDLIGLTHTGAMPNMETISRMITKEKGILPGLLVSIGCDDPFSNLATKENTMGQNGLSWAVHYYLSNALEKRYSGIPMDEAAEQALKESKYPNALNPVSWLGLIATGGYSGSVPRTKP